MRPPAPNTPTRIIGRQGTADAAFSAVGDRAKSPRFVRPDDRERGLRVAQHAVDDARDVVGASTASTRATSSSIGRDLAFDLLGAADAAHPARRRLERHRERTREMALGRFELGVAVRPSRDEPVELVVDHAERLVDALGRRARVDREEAGVFVRGAVRVHRVREAALLPHLLEQTRRHAAAERLVQHANA